MVKFSSFQITLFALCAFLIIFIFGLIIRSSQINKSIKFKKHQDELKNCRVSGSSIHQNLHPATDKEKLNAKINEQHILEKCGTRDFLPPWNPELSNDSRYESKTNCYAYAFSNVTGLNGVNSKGKLQPGWHENLRSIPPEQLSGDAIIKRVLADHPTSIWLPTNSETYKEGCPCGSYEAHLLLDTVSEPKHRDYHFVKQNLFAYSHKPGSSSVSQVDASGNYVLDVSTANWNYSNKRLHGPNYNENLGKFCVFHADDQVFETVDHPSQLDQFPENYQ